MAPVLSILVVAYNSGGVLAPCLDAIAVGTQVAHEIILVDNASQDDTLALVRRGYPAVTVIENQENRGFAAAVNQASRMARGRLLLLLNPDTVVQPGALDALVLALDAHPEAGICAPRILNTDGTLRHNCFHYPSFRSIFLHNVLPGPLRKLRRLFLRPVAQLHVDRIQEVESLSGAALLIRTALYRALGGLDERFFMYYEDEDLCYRAHLAGYTNLFVPGAVITHAGGHSTPPALGRPGRKIGGYFLASQVRYLHKHGRPWAVPTMRVVYLLLGLLYCCVGCLPLDVRQRQQLLTRGRLLVRTALAADSPFGG